MPPSTGVGPRAPKGACTRLSAGSRHCAGGQKKTARTGVCIRPSGPTGLLPRKLLEPSRWWLTGLPLSRGAAPAGWNPDSAKMTGIPPSGDVHRKPCHCRSRSRSIIRLPGWRPGCPHGQSVETWAGYLLEKSDAWGIKSFCPSIWADWIMRQDGFFSITGYTSFVTNCIPKAPELVRPRSESGKASLTGPGPGHRRAATPRKGRPSHDRPPHPPLDRG